MTKVDKFKLELEQYIISKREVTNKNLLDFSLEHGFSPKITSDFLKKLKDEKKIEHYSYPKINCRQVYKNKNIVTFKVR